MAQRLLNVKLPDVGGKGKTIEAMAAATTSGMEIWSEGYSVNTAEGDSPPVVIENYGGILRVLVWADINQENPTHVISLSEAREIFRKLDDGE